MQASEPSSPAGRSSLHKGISSVLLLAVLLSNLAILLSDQASAGCGRWVVRETTDYLADPLFGVDDPAPQEEGSSVEDDNSTELETQSSTSSEAEGLVDLAGKWLVELNESGSSHLEIILTQSGDRLQGYGTLVGLEGEVHATAKGQLSSEEVDLDVKLIEKSPGRETNHYLLSLAIVNQTLSGRYELRQGDTIGDTGKATASRLSH